MALTPISYTVDLDELDADLSEETLQPSKTWRINLETGRIERFIDDTEAIRQYIRKALMTSRNRYLIYDGYYGEDIRDLIGNSLTTALRDVEIPRLVREAIEYDERISKVSNVKITQYTADSIHIAVTVELVDGIFITEEVAM